MSLECKGRGFAVGDALTFGPGLEISALNIGEATIVRPRNEPGDLRVSWLSRPFGSEAGWRLFAG